MVPEEIFKKAKVELNIKNDQLVDKVFKLAHRYYCNMNRLNCPKAHTKGLEILLPLFFINLVEFLEEINIEWAKEPALHDWLKANKGKLAISNIE